MSDAAGDLLTGQAGLGTQPLADPALVGRSRKASDAAKRCFDVVGSVVVLLMLTPLLAITAAGMLLLQGRPIFVSHRRVGRAGKAFSCLKFRTMVVNADHILQQHLRQSPEAAKEWGASRKLQNDPRITRLGRILRQSSVDELPQLLNVLSGDMSLVGPRPITDDEIALYGLFAQKYFQVRPGITGLWQVSGRSNLPYPSRVQLDAAYVETRGLVRDAGILIRTIPAVLRARGAR